MNELNLHLSFQHITHLLQKLKNITSLNYVKYSLQKDKSLWILIIWSDEARIVEWTEFTFKLSAYHSSFAKVEKYYKFKLCKVFK